MLPPRPFHTPRAGTLLLSLAAAACGSRGAAFEFAVIGDAPYVLANEARFAAALEEMNRAELAFVVHVGDIQAPPGLPDPGGIPTCTDAMLAARKELFERSVHPFVLTPGDNDWSDCHLAGRDPLERLELLRATFFAAPTSLGQTKMPVAVQASEPGFEPYVENRSWNHEGVHFATLHLVGGNNNLGRTEEMDLEAREREAADLSWLAQAFRRARASDARAVVLVMQANPLFEVDWSEDQLYRYLLGLSVPAVEGGTATGFDGFRAALASELSTFARPVLLVHGDTHTFRMDKPLVRDDGTVVGNFTRLETFGHPDVHWIRVRVDPDDPDVFSVHPVTRAP